MTDPPLLIYEQTCDHLLIDPLDPRPGPRHAFRADPYPRRTTVPDQDDLTDDDHLVENTEKGDDGADLDLPPPPSQSADWVPDSVTDENGFPA